jgi:hypothetical protein
MAAERREETFVRLCHQAFRMARWGKQEGVEVEKPLSKNEPLADLHAKNTRMGDWQMQFNLKPLRIAIFGITFLAAGSLWASSTGPSPGASAEDNFSPYLSAQASDLLSQIREEADELLPYAERLDSFARSPLVRWQSHGANLARVKDHVNEVTAQVIELQRIQDKVAPWQRRAIAEVAAHAAQLATTTEAAILHLRENRDRLFVEEYRDHLMTIADRSELLKETVDKYLDLEKTQQRLDQLKDELGRTGTAKVSTGSCEMSA